MGKLPPQNMEAEQYVLGALMLESEKIDDVVDILTSKEEFYYEPHQEIYQAILDLYSNNSSAIDLLTVNGQLQKNGKLEKVGGAYALTKLTMNVVSSANVVAHAAIVKECYLKRKIISSAMEVIAEAYDESKDALSVVDKFGSQAIKLSENSIKKPFQHIAKALEEMMAKCIDLSLQEVKFTGVPTGFRELDRLTGGFQNSNLIILAARPSVGKTAFALNIALGAASHEVKPTPVGLFSLEMSKRELVERLAANASNLNHKNIVSGNLQDWELERLDKAKNALKKLPIYIDDTFHLNVLEIRAKARKMKMKHNVGLIIIDYLQLLDGDGTRNVIREQEISKISRGLKGLAKDLDIPVIALSQMSRAVEGRIDNVPRLSDLRESGAIEQDADDVYFLYANSKEVLKREPYRSKERHLKRAKARGGMLADLVYDFDGEHQRFENEDLTIEEAHFVPIDPPASTFKQINKSAGLAQDTEDELPF